MKKISAIQKSFDFKGFIGVASSESMGGITVA